MKTFLDGIVVKKQISITNPPGNTDGPLDVSDNTNKVINLNADLLDDEDGSFYTDASNMTGSFSYENVTFDIVKRFAMIEKRILPLAILIISLVVTATLEAQVPVKVSNEKLVSGGKVYYMHEVQKGQTLYSGEDLIKLSQQKTAQIKAEMER